MDRGGFLQNNKKFFLSCAESAAKFINERGSGAFLDLLLDIIEVSESKFEDEDKKKQYFCEIIYEHKNSRLHRILGGGKALSHTFKTFVEVFLQISKEKEEYVIKNELFKDLTLKELKYVLGWTRRLVVEQTARNTDIAHSKNRNKFNNKASNKKTKGHFTGKQNKELFNDSMATQLKSLFKNN